MVEIRAASAAEGQVLLNAILVRGMDTSGAAQAAAALGTFGLAEVPPTRTGAEHFSAGRDFESFGRGFLRFDAFGTSHKSAFSKKSAQYRRLGSWKQAANYDF